MGKLSLTLMSIFLSARFCNSKPECKGTPLKTDEEWAKNLIPPNYNEKLPPYHLGCPAEVNVAILPWGVGEISIEHMYFEVNAYVSLRWIDDRLNITNPVENEFKLEEREAARIWTPDASFRNCIKCDVLRFDYRTHKLNLQGKVLRFSIRTSAKLFCEFDLSNYPMDSHVCFIEVESSGDRKDTVVFRDGTPYHRFLRNASIPQFKVSNLKTGECSVPDASTQYMTCIEYQMTFTRQIAYHLMLTYAPSFLIVLLSWISFWLEVDAAPPRVALGLTSLLTLATQFSNAQKSLPPVSYAKAIDIWMFTCMFMVFVSLLEFAMAYNTTIRRSQPYFSQHAGINHWTKATSTSAQHQPTKKMKNRIDSASKILFPLIFLVFNICYWYYFCTR